MGDFLGIGGVASAAGSVAGAAIQANAAKQAAATQAQTASGEARALAAAGTAAQGYYNPYVAGGGSAFSDLTGNLPLYSNINNDFTNAAYSGATQASDENNLSTNALAAGGGILNNLASGGITANSISSLPGYQAQLQLGEEGVTNSAAARGLANSGAALKGAANYATTMAQNGYQNLYQDQLGTASGYNALASGYQGAAQNQLGVAQSYDTTNAANQENVSSAFDRTNTLAGYGLEGASLSGQNALEAAGLSGNYAASGANALASGVVGSGNALASGFTGSGNAASQYALYSSLLNGGLGSSRGPVGTGTTYSGPASAIYSSGDPNAAYG